MFAAKWPGLEGNVALPICCIGFMQAFTRIPPTRILAYWMAALTPACGLIDGQLLIIISTLGMPSLRLRLHTGRHGGFRINDDPGQRYLSDNAHCIWHIHSPPLSAATTVLQVIALLLTIFRIWLRVRMGKFWWEDAFALLSLMCGTIAVISLWIYLLAGERQSFSIP